MKTITQVFRNEDHPFGELEAHHLIRDKKYDLVIGSRGVFLVVSLDNLKSILKVAKRNLKEGAGK